MKKVYLFISLMLSALAVGCNNSDLVDDTSKPSLNNKVVVTVNATLPGDLTWVAGDKVAINGLESEAVAEAGAGLSTASFSMTGVAAPLVVVAPYEILTGRNEVTLPSSQSYNAEGVDRSAYAMAAIAPEALPVSADDEKNLAADVTLAPVVGKRDVKFSCFISFLKKPNHIRIFFNSLALLKICSVMGRCHITHHTCHLKNTRSTHLIPRYSLLTLLISPSLLLGNSQHSLSALYSAE